MPERPSLPKLLSSLAYSAFLAYSPSGPSEIEPHRASQVLRNRIKNDGTYRQGSAIDLAIAHLVEANFSGFDRFFGPEVVLVPAPSSSPFPKGLKIPLQGGEKDFLWVPRRICQALVSAGKAGAWRPLLRRDYRVTRSSLAQAKDRPTPLAHFESMSCEREIPANRYVVVDDVVTRGATLLASTSRLREAHPDAEVAGFALLRAVSNADEFEKIVDPVVGTITLRPHGDTLRRP